MSYGIPDIVMALLASLIYYSHIYLIAAENGLFSLNRRSILGVYIPSALALTGVALYSWKGSIGTTRPGDYELYHAIWHWFTSTAASMTFMFQPLNYMNAYKHSALQLAFPIRSSDDPDYVPGWGLETIAYWFSGNRYRHQYRCVPMTECDDIEAVHANKGIPTTHYSYRMPCSIQKPKYHDNNNNKKPSKRIETKQYRPPSSSSSRWDIY